MDEVAEFEDVTVKAQTERAILCEIDGEEHWVPQSQVHDVSEVWKKGDTGKLVVARWWAVKEGLTED